jgi:predicted nucleic-acid-binding protein
MIALDTNVLVRYLVEDDARQTALAAALIAKAVKRDERLYVADIVVCETVWVLRISYQVSRAEIARTLRQLFRARHLEFRAVDQLVRALDQYESGTGDFADYCIHEDARAAGCDSVATFDKALLRQDGFIAVK